METELSGMTRIFVRFALLLACLTCATGCAGPKEPPPRSIQVIDRAKIIAAEENLKTDPELSGCIIKVRAENDLLIMDGEVNSENAKQRAEVLVRKEKGIDKVANHLMIQPKTKSDVPGEVAPPP